MYNLYKVSDTKHRNKKYKIVITPSLSTSSNKIARNKTIYFGSSAYEDYTMHKDKERKRRYIARHSSSLPNGRKREDWNNPNTAGFYSRWLLWNKPTLKGSIKDTNKRFNINIKYRN